MSTYRADYHGNKPVRCIDIVDSPDDGGYYAQEFDFTRKDNATRTSKKIYESQSALIAALDSGSHKWGEWS
jgi:hypothetical protein